MNYDMMIQTVSIFSAIFGVAILIIVAAGDRSWGRNIKVATISWIVIASLFTFLGYWGPVPFSVLILIIALTATHEFYNLNKVYSKSLMFVSSALILGMAWTILFSGNPQWFYYFPGLALLILVPLQLFKGKTVDFINQVARQYLGLIYWGWMFLHFILLINMAEGYGIVVVLCSMIALNDNSAFFVGILLGKNSPKFAPQISPNKTWAGFGGGFVATIVVAATFAYALPELVLWKRFVLGTITALVIPVGDLIESAMKRDLNIKDSGNIIPGHGGMMDRFDSWTFTSPVVYYVYHILIRI